MNVWREDLEDLQAQFTDFRVYEKEDVQAGLLFLFHLVDFLDECGYEYRGHNIKYMGWQTLLVVKATLEGTPLVAFVNERSTTRCMRIFCRKLVEKRVTWQEDRFA
jgi:hypothetical protein